MPLTGKDRKEYMKIKRRSELTVSLSFKEKTLLQQMMEKEEWENVSGFIKYKLFGLDTDTKYKKKLKKGNATDHVIALREIGFEIVKKFDYLIYLYNKNTKQLWREEGVDMKRWLDTTTVPFQRAEQAVLEYLAYVRDIAEVLDLDEYFDVPSNHITFDPETATKEEMDAMAEQLRKERAFKGHSFKTE